LGGKTVLSSRRLDARSHNLYPVTRIPYTEPSNATRRFRAPTGMNRGRDSPPVPMTRRARSPSVIRLPDADDR
jgi:hypothetical protein